MRQRLRNYFIGKYLRVEDPFERADALLLYQFSLAFFFIFFLQITTDVIHGFHKATLKHSIDVFMLAFLPFVIRHAKKLEHTINYFFTVVFITSFFGTMMLNSDHLDGILVSRVMFFILMSALLQTGLARILFTCFFGWIPLFYVILNVKLNGALTWHWIVQPGTKDASVYVLFIPIILGIYAIWNHTDTMLQAKITIKKQKHIIEERNVAITDSITYAKRIQKAKLPEIKDIQSAFQDSFVLFKPKDIVSGDFYFYHKTKESVFLAAADCTGHGVPGALMSMIGFERLDDALEKTTEPSEVLKLLNLGIKKSLRQTDASESSRDGMDIALCRISLDTMSLTYAGANRPVYIMRKDQDNIEEIKGTKKAIGGFTNDDQHFESHEIKFHKGDSFYIFSDGYADTFGGKKQKKLSTKRFKQILVSIRHKSMQEQESYLNKFILDWMAGIEQVDDILVMGVRL